MANKASELQLRIVSALVLALIALPSVWAGGIAFSVVVSVVALLVFLEWTAIIGLTAFESKRMSATGLMLAVLLILMVFGPGVAIIALALCAAAIFYLTLATTRETAFWTTGALIYCGLAAISLVGLRGGEMGFETIVLLFAMVWGSDIGAYFVGRKFGGPKLAPKISPGKTQSGAIGGLVIAMIAGGIVAAVTHVLMPFTAIIVAAFISAVSQIGDLFESYLKRRFGVKDSGALVPGHGGLFDRVDGLMPAAIVLFTLSQIF